MSHYMYKCLAGQHGNVSDKILYKSGDQHGRVGVTEQTG